MILQALLLVSGIACTADVSPDRMFGLVGLLTLRLDTVSPDRCGDDFRP